MIAYCKRSIDNAALSKDSAVALIRTPCEEVQHVKQHEHWCKSYSLFKRIIMRQEKYGGRLEPKLPIKILKQLPAMASKTHDIYQKLNLSKFL